MTTNGAPHIDHYWIAIADALPVLTSEEQRAALTLYQELAKGQPVGAQQLAAALNIPAAKAAELLQRPSIKALTYPDEHGRVLGFGGLAAAPMHHIFRVDGRTLWTWCAWDSLFIPELLGATAHVESPDPESGEIVRLDVGPRGVTTVEPGTAVVSFLKPDATEFDKSAANVMATFCNFVFFFASRESGDRWVAKHRGTFLFSVDEAVALARRLNAKVFGLVLSQQSCCSR
jgi:alkylmercury lyase